MALGARLTRRPARTIAALCFVQIALWTLAPTLSHDAPPLDVVEGYLWGPHLLIASYKHPALPSWILEASRQLTGAIGWPAYIASQLAIALTYLAVFALGRDILGAQRALAGTVLLTGVYYFVWPSIEFNHNVAQMPAWAGLALAVWRAVERRSLVWWLLAGLIGAAGIYAKLSTSVLIAAAGLWVLADGRARASLRTPGPWLGLLVLVALVAPLVLWLIEHEFQPLSYAVGRGILNGRFALIFLAEQALALVLMPLTLLWIGALRWPWSSTPDTRTLGLACRPRTEQRFLNYALALTLGPILVTVVGSLISGIGVKGMWGSPGLNLVGLIAVMLLGGRLTSVARDRLAVTAAVFMLLVPIGYAVSTLTAPLYGRPKRQNYPQAKIASTMRALFQAETSRPLTIVLGEQFNWVGGLVGLSAREMADVAPNGELRLTPWITPDRMAHEGYMIAWEHTGRGGPSENLRTLALGYPVRQAQFAWPRFPTAPPLLIDYVIVPPGR